MELFHLIGYFSTGFLVSMVFLAFVIMASESGGGLDIIFETLYGFTILLSAIVLIVGVAIPIITLLNGAPADSMLDFLGFAKPYLSGSLGYLFGYRFGFWLMDTLENI